MRMHAGPGLGDVQRQGVRPGDGQLRESGHVPQYVRHGDALWSGRGWAESMLRAQHAMQWSPVRERNEQLRANGDVSKHLLDVDFERMHK
jgi:hypothetical protein